jgi:hypothetical protein
MTGKQVEAPHPCETCGKKFTVRGATRAAVARFCSRSCGTGRPPSRVASEKACLMCGKAFTVLGEKGKAQKLCSAACRNAFTTQTRTKRVPWACPGCSQVLQVRPWEADLKKFCSTSCSSKTHNTGEGNPAWAGGNATYWKQRCRERDDFTCRFPGCGLRDEGRRTHAHHRLPREAGGADTLENLVTLCEKHHREIETLLLKQINERYPKLVDAEVQSLYEGLKMAALPPLSPPADVVFVKP